MTLKDKRRAKRRFPRKPDIVPGRLGDGFGNVRHPSLLNHCYIRISGKLQVVYNDQTPYTNDLQVDCGRDVLATSETPGIFKVLSTRTTSPGGVGTTIQTGFAPASRYEYMAMSGGEDPLWVQGMQIIPLRVGQYSGLTIQVQAGMIWNGSLNIYVPFTTMAMTAHVPSAAGKAALVLITVKSDGTLIATKGAEFTLASMTTTALMLANRPAAPAGTIRELALVRVYTAQTAIVEGRSNSDFTDLRFAYRGFETGNIIPVAVKTADYTLTTYNSVVVFTATATATLPAAIGSGILFRIACVGAYVVTIDGNSNDTINGSLTQSITDGESLSLVDYAANKWVIV